jgi:hypothetical protein
VSKVLDVEFLMLELAFLCLSTQSVIFLRLKPLIVRALVCWKLEHHELGTRSVCAVLPESVTLLVLIGVLVPCLFRLYRPVLDEEP